MVLLLAGLLVGVAAVVGAATPADGGPRGGVPVAAFLAALPGLLALAVGARRPTAGLALTAAAGWWGVARLLADLSVVGDASTVVRPELFAETSARSQPFTAASGAWLLLFADVIWIAAGVLATRAVAPRLLPDRPAGGALFGDPEPQERAADDPAGDRAVRDGRTRWSLPVVTVGLLGVVLVAVGALDPGYVGGFLDLRALPPGTTLLGVLGTGLAVIVAGGLVLVAAAGSRSLAVPLLVGSALAAAVPFLVVLAVVAAGSSIGSPGVSGSVWWGLAGAVLLGLAGLLAPRDEGPDDPVGGGAVGDDAIGVGAGPGRGLPAGASPGAPSTTTAATPGDDRAAPAAGALALLSGVLSAGAAFLPVLLVAGRTPTRIAGELVAPIGPPFATAAVPLLVAGVLTLVVPTRRAGLVAISVLWAGPVLALTQALTIRGTTGDVVGSAQAASQLKDPGPTWSDGAGFWLAWAAVLLAVAAAVIAAIAARRLTDAGTAVPDETSVADSRPVRVGLAAGLSVLTLVALSVPIYSTLGRGAATTLVSGYDVDVWGRWAVAAAVLVGVWSAVRTLRVDVAVAAPVAAAVAAVQPLLVPSAVRAQVGFEWRTGLWLVGALVVLLLVAAPVFGRQAARVRERETRPLAI